MATWTNQAKNTTSYSNIAVSSASSWSNQVASSASSWVNQVLN